MDGPEYKIDGRCREPNADGYRKGRFKVGWKHAIGGDEPYNAITLETLYWQNLGYRLGKLLGKASVAIQEEMYDVCVKQQEEQERGGIKNVGPQGAV